MAHVRRRRHIKIQTTLTGPKKVKVGFPAGTDTDIVDKAIWNHYGTSRGIPARPFLLNAMRRQRRKYLNIMKEQGARILRGETTLTAVMNKLGVLAQGDVQAEIDATLTPPNAPATIKAKGSSHPLIESGEMKRSVTWKVEG